ncbi:hypothetical protein ABEF95_010028 [Exophiala dermatitidis]
MVLGRKTRNHGGGTTVTTTTTTTHHPGPVGTAAAPRVGRTKPTLMQRLRGRATPRATTTTARPARRSRFGGTRTKRTAVTATPRRKTSVSDKVSGAMLKLRGTLTRRPGQKAAGSRRMHGTDGRVSRRFY